MKKHKIAEQDWKLPRASSFDIENVDGDDSVLPAAAFTAQNTPVADEPWLDPPVWGVELA